MRLKKSCVLWTGLAMLAPMAVQAESLHPKLDTPFYLDLGFYQPTTTTKLRVDGAGGKIGSEISLEDDLNFDDRPQMPTVLMNFRLGERWRIEAEYFAIDRDNSRQIDRDITIGDITYPIHTTVSSGFTSNIYRLSAGYSFLKNQNSELGAVLGLHVTDFKLNASNSIQGSENKDALAPLPTIGVYGFYALSPKWLLTGRADVFSLDYDKYSGTLWNVNAGVEYQVAKHFGVGLAYRYVDYNVSVTKDVPVGSTSTDFTGEITYRLSGPNLYMSLMF